MKIQYGHIQFLQYLGVKRTFISKNPTNIDTEKNQVFLAKSHLKLPIRYNNVIVTTS